MGVNLPSITKDDEGKYLMVKDGRPVWSAMPIKYVESLDYDNMLNIRSLSSGSYVLYGKFQPFAGSPSVLTFSSALLVNIITKTAGTWAQVFYPASNQVQFLSITNDNYERTNIPLNDLYALLDQSGA